MCNNAADNASTLSAFHFRGIFNRDKTIRVASQIRKIRREKSK